MVRVSIMVRFRANFRLKIGQRVRIKVSRKDKVK
jgi:hypothetical protein